MLSSIHHVQSGIQPVSKTINPSDGHPGHPALLLSGFGCRPLGSGSERTHRYSHIYFHRSLPYRDTGTLYFYRHPDPNYCDQHNINDTHRYAYTNDYQYPLSTRNSDLYLHEHTHHDSDPEAEFHPHGDLHTYANVNGNLHTNTHGYQYIHQHGYLHSHILRSITFPFL